jgi:site-specific DNA-methyltransferase (adenine-specific)
MEDETGRRFQAIDLTGAGVRKGDSGKPWRGIDPTAVKRHWALPGNIMAEIGIQGETSQEKLDALDAAKRIFWPQKEGGKPRLKFYLDELEGAVLSDMWFDIPPISAHAKERLGYPTQKPEALLERIILASSSEGDLVLDPFCGCGTTISVAERLKRRWIGIDITYLAINLIKNRLVKSFPTDLWPYVEFGVPQDVLSAERLAQINPFQFEWWALAKVGAIPAQDKRKGPDRGVDGQIFFQEKDGGKFHKIVLQVKSGKVGAAQVRDLKGAMEREKAAIGALITLKPPTRAMKEEAAAAGVYESEYFPQASFPRLQIITIAEAFAGKQLEYPRWVPNKTIKNAARQRKGPAPEDKQGNLL